MYYDKLLILQYLIPQVERRYMLVPLHLLDIYEMEISPVFAECFPPENPQLFLFEEV